MLARLLVLITILYVRRYMYVSLTSQPFIGKCMFVFVKHA